MARKLGKVWFVVADGARARVVERDETSGAFQTIRQIHSDDALKRSSELGSDRPGRVVESRSASRHAASPRHDLQREAKRAFARETADHVNRAGEQGEFDHLVLAAPARVLNEIKKHLTGSSRERTVGELAKDLTHTPDADLAGHFAEIMQQAHKAPAGG
jgi:protein required for attachment to host cells